MSRLSITIPPSIRKHAKALANGNFDAVAFARASLARKLILDRRASGLSQAELARRAGVRVETLNRVERGKTTPDFRTIRKLVLALGRETGVEAHG